MHSHSRVQLSRKHYEQKKVTLKIRSFYSISRKTLQKWSTIAEDTCTNAFASSVNKSFLRFRSTTTHRVTFERELVPPSKNALTPGGVWSLDVYAAWMVHILIKLQRHTFYWYSTHFECAFPRIPEHKWNVNNGNSEMKGDFDVLPIVELEKCTFVRYCNWT